jgi:WD40 repeat protein
MSAEIEPAAILTGHRSDVLSVAFAPDDTLLATASRDRTIRLWSLPDGAHLATLEGHRGPVHCIAFSPAGDVLASASGDMTTRLWLLGERGQASRPTLSVLSGHQGAVEAIAFSASGHRLACGWNMWSYGHISLWDIHAHEASCELAATIRTAHGQVIFGLAYAPTSNLLAAALAGGMIRLWADQKEAFTIRGHGEAVRAVAFSPDGERLASVSSDGMLKLWEIAARGGGPLATLRGHVGAINAVAYSSDGADLATAGSDGTVRLWDATRGEPLAVFAVGRVAHCVACSGDGMWLAAGLSDGSVHLWAPG